MQKRSKIILGIDPGTLIMGYGLIAVENNSISLIELGVLKPGKVKDGYKKLQLIFNTVSGLITKYQPDHFAIEAPFFGKNVQSMLKLGRAQGVAIAAAMRHGLEVVEYSPKKVKQSITGNGNADKEQVMRMLQTILSFKENPKHYDATDALAVAVCHHFQFKLPLANTTPNKIKKPVTKNSSWDKFIKENPDRIRRYR
ncbi:MAG: crossover junction endodeoxyribonuclease RuvC [Bacteroidetes bacterium]|nr:crossover junction endodeoxyribonuclease RuvC [Bacteroidota bacterium]MBS1610979.1 crossover junction endodeoxyribonuclease RuvC [Bacteroidota bacterium]